MKNPATAAERVEFWNTKPELGLVGENGLVCRTEVIGFIAELLDRPSVLEIGVDCGHVLKACSEVFGSYLGVDISLDKVSFDLFDPPRLRFIEMDSKTFWRELPEDRTWDLIFVDGCHSLLGSYLDVTQAMFRLNEGGYVLAHDTAVAESGEDDTSARWTHNRLCTLPGWYARIMEKHNEGLSIYFKK